MSWFGFEFDEDAVDELPMLLELGKLFEFVLSMVMEGGAELVVLFVLFELFEFNDDGATVTTFCVDVW